MSLSIDVASVTDVLLADGWHKIDDGSFNLDAYEFLEGDRVVLKGGQSGICATGFSFVSQGTQYSGPLTSVLAVRHR